MIDSMPLFVPAAKFVQVPIFESPSPTLYIRFGDWFALAAVLLFRQLVDYTYCTGGIRTKGEPDQGGGGMNFIEQLEEEPLSEVIRYRSSMPKDAVAFSGTLRKHPNDPEKCILFAEPTGSEPGDTRIPEGRHQGGRGAAFPRRRDRLPEAGDALMDTQGKLGRPIRAVRSG